MSSCQLKLIIYSQLHVNYSEPNDSSSLILSIDKYTCFCWLLPLNNVILWQNNNNIANIDLYIFFSCQISMTLCKFQLNSNNNNNLNNDIFEHDFRHELCCNSLSPRRSFKQTVSDIFASIPTRVYKQTMDAC